MQKEKLMDRLCSLADSFNAYAKNKCWHEALSCYKSARALAVNGALPEAQMQEAFGERGERGEIIRQGMFREGLVQKVFYEECVKSRKTEERQKNSA